MAKHLAEYTLSERGQGCIRKYERSRHEQEMRLLVVRLDGNNVVEGRRILTDANHPLVTLEDTMDGAAAKAAELAAK